MHVMLDHAGGVLVGIRVHFRDFGALFRADVRAEVHPRSTPPDEEGLASSVGAFDEVDCRIGCVIVDGFHALFRQRARVFDLAVGG